MKMVYLLEKVEKKDKENDRLNLSHSVSPKGNGKKKIIR